MMQIKPNPMQLDISSFGNFEKKGAMQKEKALISRNDVWHKIVIINGTKYDKEYLLKTILNAVHPADMIPVRYQTTGCDTFFIARNCSAAIEKLCENKLLIKVINKEPIILNITLAYASVADLKISIKPLILSSLIKRYDKQKCLINLENFHRDDELLKNVYCPISQVRTFNHVLKLIETSTTPSFVSLTMLNLKNNNLTTLAAFENANLNTLNYLDIRNNLLIDINTLGPLVRMPIKILYLDGNPLCENYSNAQLYINSVKKYCGKLKKLDGITIEDIDLPNIYESYLPDRNIECLVKLFTSHFFTLHDQNDKSIMYGLYHDDALYSVTAKSCEKNDVNDVKSYFNINRNLIQDNSFNMNDKLIYHGPDEIIKILGQQNFCIHDKNSFSYDLIFMNKDKIIFTVYGLLVTSPNSRSFNFNRTFVLLKIYNEYKILNDMYHIGDYLPNVMANLNNYNIDYTYKPQWLSRNEKNILIKKFMKLSTLNEVSSMKLLEANNWNIKKAVIQFVKKYKSSGIPAEAFM
ncbi:nuclear RNA export factor 1-like [Aphidius gifuensis]|uniref:nuclear RNA export factor 1-like n=1 Tax=Aphidius gifuensis TaxID=684658 RepID=UPI001CDC2C6F|nr:nuclear RNA export factor 1-like [Aphidius gifuensis]